MVGIKDFKMPSCCGECQMASCTSLDGHFYCDITTYEVDMDDTERDADCPLVKAIPKADYENRLKADMAAMLEELALKLYEQYDDTDLIKVKYIRQAIQQKIDKLRGEQA